MGLLYFLLRLLLKPMREAIELLDRFIKDTTHELNTLVNAIMSNIEMIDTKNLDEKLSRKIKRIDIGARTISNLYQDLTYLTLANKLVSCDENVSLSELIEERIEYFSLFYNSKKLTVSFTCKRESKSIQKMRILSWGTMGKKALAKSQVIKGWNKENLVVALKGYKDGSYGGAIKGLMKGQVAAYDDAKIDAVSEHISKF